MAAVPGSIIPTGGLSSVPKPPGTPLTLAFLSPNQKTKTLSITFVQEGAETLYPSRMATDNTKKVKNQEKLLG
jgi:hypothetical protein